MKTLAKVDEAPQELLRLAFEYKDDVDEFEDQIKWDFPMLQVTRQQVRDLIKLAVKEDELDASARNPTSVDVMIGSIDRSLNKDILSLTARSDILHKVGDIPNDEFYTVDGTGEEIYAIDARKELNNIRQKLMEIKESLVNSKKSEAVIGGSVNVNFDLGGMMKGMLDNIDKMGLSQEIIDAK